jgi:mono/diheme cytochrome c family protein
MAVDNQHSGQFSGTAASSRWLPSGALILGEPRMPRRIPTGPHARPQPALDAGRSTTRWSLFLLLAFAGPTVCAAEAESSVSPDYGRVIRPLLTEHCVRCHGPDTAEGGLDLTDRDVLLAPRDSGRTAVVSGDPEASELLRRIASQDPLERMPPEDPPLTAGEVEAVRRWIAAGAAYEVHWAFRPLRRPDVPALRAPEGAVRPIDAFIAARLESEGIAASPPADPHTLVKRVYLDLTGLLPTPEAVAAFVTDPSDAAWEALVDDLLASPHFGERWGRHWLDLARYADSDGYEKDRPRPDAYVYRDWVIDAFNTNMPFDRFTIEQLAGDLLPDATTASLVATAFNRQTLTNTEGGVDQEEYRVAACMDRTDTVGSVWLGLTVACAKCHTHKYDPLSHSEYFGLYAFFNDADEVVTRLPVDAADPVGLEPRLAPLRRALVARERALAPAQRRWEEEQRALLESTPDPALEVRPATIAAVTSSTGLVYAVEPDGSWRVRLPTASANKTASMPDTDVLTLTLADLPAEITGLRLETIPDPELPGGGAGLAADGTFVVNRIRAEVVAADGTALRSLPLQQAKADAEAKGFAATAVLAERADPRRGWGGPLAVTKPHHLQARTRERIALDAGERLRLHIDQTAGGSRLLGRFRVRALVGDWAELHLSPEVVKALRMYPEKRVYETRQTLFDHFASQDAEVRRLREEIDTLLREAKARVMPVRMISTARLDRPTHRFDRGDFLSPAEVVEPGVPAVLPPLTAGGGRLTRLDLARWLVGPANPLTARVIANQWWARLFGRGLVPSVGDFGTRGEPPSHPELLDWLATTYRDDLRWDTKAFLRTILRSATYRQASAHRPELVSIDPLNTLLARQNRLRVEAEIVRDLALEVSGLLTPTIGGPSVFPPMPADLAALSYANNFTWQESTGSDRYRRGMYTFFKRTLPHPTLMTFDCPDANLTCVVRSVSNTPLQALTLLNETVFVEASQALAKRLLALPDLDDRTRLDRGIAACLCRPAERHELDRLAALLLAARHHYAGDAEGARALVGNHAAEGVPAAESAAWVATLRVLLNLDEFITRE